MHNLRFLILTITAAISIITNAQDTTKVKGPWTVKVGFIFTPQGSLDLKRPEDGTKHFGTMIAVTTITKGKLTAVPYYSFGANAVGIAHVYQVIPQWSMYTVAQKNLRNTAAYVSLGALTPVADGRFSGFLELGTALPGWNPTLYAGAFIGLTRPIRTKKK